MESGSNEADELEMAVLTCTQDERGKFFSKLLVSTTVFTLFNGTGRSSCLSTEGLRGSFRIGHHHTRQLIVAADWKVPSTLQISAGAAATEEGGTPQVVASQLQADI